jgi:hypothetical protein
MTEVQTISTNGVEREPVEEPLWYGTHDAARVLGVSGARLRQMRAEGAIPADAALQQGNGEWQFDRVVIDKMALGVTAPAAPATPEEPAVAPKPDPEPEPTETPIEDVWLAPAGAVAMGVLVAHSPIRSESGRATSALMALMPAAYGYTNTSTVSTVLRDAEAAGLVNRDMAGKRTYTIKITPRGKRWAKVHEVEVPDASAPEPEPEPEPPAEPEPAPEPPAEPDPNQPGVGGQDGPALMAALQLYVAGLVAERDAALARAERAEAVLDGIRSHLEP